MNSYLNMTSGGIAKHNDFSTHDDSQTTNHIYLHPGPNQGEFDNWMRRIGSLLQVGADYTALRPVLDLIIARTEERRVGKECVRTCRPRLCQVPKTKKTNTINT